MYMTTRLPELLCSNFECWEDASNDLRMPVMISGKFLTRFSRGGGGGDGILS